MKKELLNYLYKHRFLVVLWGVAFFGAVWVTGNYFAGFDLPVSVLVLAVTFSSVTGGVLPGALASVFSALVLVAWSLSPFRDGHLPHFPFARLITFLSVSGVITVLCSWLLRAKRAAEINLRRFRDSSAREHQLRQEYAVRSLELARAEHLFTETSQSLLQSEQKFRSIFDNLSVGIGQVDAVTRRFTNTNSRLAELLGYGVAELLEKTVSEITHPEDRTLDAGPFKKLVSGEIKQYCLEKRLLRKDGSVIWARISANLGPPDRNARRMVIGIVQDITVEKSAAIESQRAKEAAEKATEAKSYFLANMSHEIRTPLGAVVGFSELIGDPQTTSQERSVFLAAIKRNSELLSNIIDDILDLSKIEAGKISIDPHEISPEDVITDIHWMLSRKAREKGISLRFIHSPGAPQTIVTDPLRLKQILINLVGNAIKFTAAGEVEVTTSPGSNSSGASLLIFHIRDTGSGIPKDQVPKLFAPFSQADMTHKRKHGGTGLGLVLSKRLAELLGGDVRLLETVVEKGSTFQISVAANLTLRRSFDSSLSAEAPASYPVQKVAAFSNGGLSAGIFTAGLPGAGAFAACLPGPTDPAPTSADQVVSEEQRLDGIRVLLAEDSIDNQILIGRMLRLAGAVVDIASNGREAVEKVEHGIYDTLLMDLQMPIMDGYEATRELRKKGYTGKIVAFTAHAFSEDRARCLQGGFDRHVSKPVNPNTLISAISSLAKKDARQA